MRSVSPLAIAMLMGLSAACAPEGSSAYVSRNVPLNAQCDPESDGDVGIATGIYDVGSANLEANCVHPYLMSLQINSNLKANGQDSTGRAEPNVLLVTHADVRLMNKDEYTLNFSDATRPNPYRVHTAASLNPTTSSTAETGLVQIEAIPRVYADKLTGYEGDNILVEVTLFGTTTGNVEVEFRPFLYPLAICRGCLSFCRGDLEEGEEANLKAERCEDNAAQDGRVCIDPTCGGSGGR